MQPRLDKSQESLIDIHNRNGGSLVLRVREQPFKQQTKRDAHQVVIANTQNVLPDQTVLPQTQNRPPQTRLYRALGLVNLYIDLRTHLQNLREPR